MQDAHPGIAGEQPCPGAGLRAVDQHRTAADFGDSLEKAELQSEEALHIDVGSQRGEREAVPGDKSGPADPLLQTVQLGDRRCIETGIGQYRPPERIVPESRSAAAGDLRFGKAPQAMQFT